MKNKAILFGIITFAFVGMGYAQDVEHDDMYFTSKDRAKLRASQKAEELAYASVKRRNDREDEELNPTDSYSARNINPEYTSRKNSQIAQADNGDYFVNNYQFNRGSNYNNFNNNFNNWYGNSWYRPNYWGPSIYAWNSPYYGYYDSWNSPWYDPYWSYNGYSSGYSYYAGSNYNYGWGGSYNYWNRPYYAGNNYFGYGSSFGYGSNWYWNNYRPTVVIVNNNSVDNGRGVAYGRRPSRGSYYASPSNDTRTRTTVTTNTRGDNSSGRTRTEYYNNAWRYNNYGNSNSSNNSGSYDSRSQTQYNRSSSWNNNNSNSSFENSGSRSNSSGFDSGTRTHSAPASSGGGTSGGSGGGRSRRD